MCLSNAGIPAASELNPVENKRGKQGRVVGELEEFGVNIARTATTSE
jgi:hypothetical protein